MTRNFGENLRSIEYFHAASGIPSRRFDELLDQLEKSLIPQLERFPAIGRDLLARPVLSQEVMQAMDELRRKLHAAGANVPLREYVLREYVVLYAVIGDTVFLLAIKHHRQLSFDLASIWPPDPV